MLDGRIMAIVRPFDHPELGGAITIIDTKTYVENTQPVASSVGMPGPAQTAATPNQVRTDLVPSPGGRFSSAFPLWDGTGRVLTTWSICRLEEPDPANPTDPEAVIYVPCTPQRLAATNPAPVVAPPLYGVWMYDPTTQTQQPIVIGEEGVLVSDIVAAQPRRTPTSIPDKLPGVDFDAELAAEEAGIINIRSVYDLDGVASVNIAAVANPVITPPGNRPARFLRIEKAVAIPDEDTVDLDRHGVRPEHSAGHARGDRLRADRAGRLRAHQGAGQRGARAERPRRQRPAHVGSSPELASGRAGAGADLQRLPRAREQSLARPQHGVQRRVRRCDEHGRCVPGHGRHVLAGCR